MAGLRWSRGDGVGLLVSDHRSLLQQNPYMRSHILTLTLSAAARSAWEA